jgi:hypothetical protein
MFQPSKVPTKIYILSFVHISLKIHVPHTNNSRLPENSERPAGWGWGVSTVLVPLLYELCSLAYGELTITLSSQYVYLKFVVCWIGN